ncbi:MAG: hypothetical protein ACD_43C00066G0001 [uncultured bacterium]|nr:MAG: hypothetical protein ACD_43C00066G0001 [uncultured bacterium]
MTTTISSALTESQQKQLLAILLQTRPVLKQLLAQAGRASLVEYEAAYYRSGLRQPQPGRQAEFLQTFAVYARKYFDQPTVEQVVTQLRKYYVVSTADHHAPLFPSCAFQANALTAAAYRTLNDAQLNSIIILGCSSVSLNHRDFPRGFLYHSIVGDDIVTERIAIFPSKWQMCPVFQCPAYTMAQLNASVKQLQVKISQGTLKAVTGERLIQLLMEYYADPTLLAKQYYSEQVAQLNRKLWRTLWGPKQPDLLYIDEEGLVSQLILNHHLTQNTVIHALLFDETVRAHLLPQLVQAMAGYLHQQGVGTNLFWALSPTNHHRVPLQIKQQALVSSDATTPIQIPLTPEHIQTALQTKQIFPNLMLCYTVLNLYYQLNCFGGFNQQTYLTAMQEVYGASKYDAAFQPVITPALHYGLYSAFTAHQQQAMALDGMDLWLYGQPKFYPAWDEALHRVTVQQSLQWLAPALYRYLSADEQSLYDKAALTKFILTDSIERSSNQPAILSINY